MKYRKFKFKKVKSTNTTAIRIIKDTSCISGMVISETQSKGKGQYGRKWISFKGNLFVSFFNELSKKNFTIDTITKMNCLLVKKTLSKFTSKNILFKKPNDLLIDKKKISGILQEIVFKKDRKFIVTGIGINIVKHPNIKNYPATSLQKIAKKSISKLSVENKLKQIFEKNSSKLYKN
ncbi:biotin--[acetyl-CoA-carboxylase] ligase [Candidatus Pelagibacter communis]|uniref:biotin--[acetyl-CoA-carboxylase] ligase n=1 Tax=Pelagibacter ubique TaxID=198252 RepID=UPI00094C656B|nr:biotin--[acetyl-CoA-carboxylase] ligase [Candidatus Pelagibacter ubique]|tara:strand:+ start:682 stop:1215 length:534 start_codon:yes stop_codon:yes gene_type:complete